MVCAWIVRICARFDGLCLDCMDLSKNVQENWEEAYGCLLHNEEQDGIF